MGGSKGTANLKRTNFGDADSGRSRTGLTVATELYLAQWVGVGMNGLYACANSGVRNGSEGVKPPTAAHLSRAEPVVTASTHGNLAAFGNGRLEFKEAFEAPRIDLKQLAMKKGVDQTSCMHVHEHATHAMLYVHVYVHRSRALTRSRDQR